MKSSFGLTYVQIDKDTLDIAYNIQKEIFPDDPDYDDLYDKAINSLDDNCFFIVYFKNDLIGITGVDVYREYPDTIWLDWFGILPKYRRNGFGEEVLLDTIEYCKKLNKYKSFRVETTYYENRPAVFLYDKVMKIKEEYTIEDTKDKKRHTLIYTYPLIGEVELWNNRYLGLGDYYGNL